VLADQFEDPKGRLLAQWRALPKEAPPGVP